jgi:hypothetical protein
MKYFILYIQPLKMELIEGSETSANHNRTPGKYPKEYIQDSKHGESLKSRNIKLHENSSCGSRFVTCGRADGRTDRRKIKVAFRNFANAPKNQPLHLQACGFPPGKRKPGVDHVREMSRPQRMSEQISCVCY